MHCLIWIALHDFKILEDTDIVHYWMAKKKKMWKSTIFKEEPEKWDIQENN